MDKLLAYLPDNALSFIQKWSNGFKVKINITRDRSSKLGDYHKDQQGTHQITINHNLKPELFFFVLTHELAHLLAFEHFGRKIPPHGVHWKTVYRNMLLESIHIYSSDLQPYILTYAKNPKANFNAFTPLVKYFSKTKMHDGEVLVEQLTPESLFMYRGEMYLMVGKLRKNYLCIQQGSLKKYTFNPMASVVKIENS